MQSVKFTLNLNMGDFPIFPMGDFPFILLPR